jgi:HEPN domain-containing protein
LTSREFVRKWVEKAEENLRAAEVLAERGMYAAACFHAQQAAEMALKGLLINLAGIQPLTHLLVEIAEKVMEYSTVRLPDVNELRWLQEHYLQTRYPNARLSEYVAEEAERAVRIAAEVVKAVNEEIRR